MVLSVAVWLKSRFAVLLLIAACCVATMPKTWYYIKGCPCPEECSRLKTAGAKRKVLTFNGLCQEDAVENCAQHLMNSQLHNKGRKWAFDMAWEQTLHEYEEPTDDEAEAGGEEDPEEAIVPRPPKCRRLTPVKLEAPPLLDDLNTRVAALVGRPSSSQGQSLREARRLIADAEEAAQKAQGIALQAAAAFQEVAQKLSSVLHSLD